VTVGAANLSSTLYPVVNASDWCGEWKPQWADTPEKKKQWEKMKTFMALSSK